MVHNPNSPCRNKNSLTNISSGSEEELNLRIKELIKRGFTLEKKWEETPKDVASSINKGSGYQRRFYGTYMKRYNDIMKRGN